MAEERAKKAAVREQNAVATWRGYYPIACAIAGWVIPGLGDGLQKMWGRAATCFLCVGSLAIVSAAMRGNIFASTGNDAFDFLGYLADLGAGSFYFLARTLEALGPDVSRASGDYGTRFMATAGGRNLLAALHAYEKARGVRAG